LCLFDAKLSDFDKLSVSKLERRADMYISTLSDFIKALEGKLEIRAIFRDGDIRITQFQMLRKSA